MFRAPQLPSLDDSRVLLVITSYNHLNYTLATLQYILDNTDTFDIAVFDDCSEDGTVDAIRALGFAVTSFSQPLGTTAMWNHAYNHASLHGYDVIILSNNDVLAPSGSIAKLVDSLKDQTVGLTVPVTTTKGAGFNAAQGMDALRFSSQNHLLSGGYKNA